MGNDLTYAVLGTGALGGYYGGMLAKGGRRVCFQVRTGFEEVKRQGLVVESCDGDFTLPKAEIYADTGSMPKADVVLVCLKTTANHLLPEMLKPILKEGTLVILVQNGLLFEEELSEELPGVPIAGASAFICSFKVAPGHIKHCDFGHISFALLEKSEAACELLDKVKDDFIACGVEASVEADLPTLRWRKLVWNIPYNGMTVVMDTSTDKLMRNPESRKLIKDLMLETQQGAAACGVAIESEFIEKMLTYTDSMVPYAPSMKLDYDAKRPMEIKGIYSNPLKAAIKGGADLKKIRMLEQQLYFKQSEYLK
jgi:2-dehydropantoate 2-reductase